MIRKYLSLSICALALTACGGGSDGGSSPTPNNQPPATATPTPSQPAPTPAPTPVQTGDSDSVNLSGVDLSVYNQLNLARKQCGFNPLTYDAQLQNAATNHANYLKTVTENSKTAYASHDEKADNISMLTGANNPYFSGVDATSRVKYNTSNNKALPVNYNAMVVGENIAVRTLTTTAQVPTQPTSDKTAISLLGGLLAAPYHQRTLFLPLFSQVGINASHVNYQENQGNSRVDYLELMLGLPSTASTAKNLPKLGRLATYPCEGITDTEYQLTNEQPSPFGSRDLATDPVGQPIYFYTNDNKTLSTYTANLTQNGKAVDVINLNANNDPNKLLGANEFFIVPNKKLTPSTPYKVDYTVNYTDGSTDKGQFTFTTKN